MREGPSRKERELADPVLPVPAVPNPAEKDLVPKHPKGNLPVPKHPRGNLPVLKHPRGSLPVLKHPRGDLAGPRDLAANKN